MAAVTGKMLILSDKTALPYAVLVDSSGVVVDPSGAVGTAGVAMERAAVDAATNGTRDLIAAPGAGFQLWIYHIYLGSTAAGTADFIDSTPADLSGTIPVAANGGVKDSRVDEPLFKCATNKKFQVTLSDGPALAGYVLYRTVAV